PPASDADAAPDRPAAWQGRPDRLADRAVGPQRWCRTRRRRQPPACTSALAAARVPAARGIGCATPQLAGPGRSAHRTGEGGASTAGGVLDPRVVPQCPDELVDPLVVGVLDLELVAPRLQRDRRVEPFEGAHEQVVVAAYPLGETLDL